MPEDSKTDTLKISQGSEIRAELEVTQVPTVSESEVETFVKELLEGAETNQGHVEVIGAEVQKRSASQLGMLKQPIRALSQRGADGGDVANSLVNLKMKVEELDPGKLNLDPGWFSRTVGLIPGVGTPLKRYLSKFESAQTVITSIVSSLEKGRDQLNRDTVTLSEDQNQMRETSLNLMKSIQFAETIDKKLSSIPAGDPKYKYVSEELLFPLRQRITDLQQQLAVHQQGILAIELIVRNNRELARGVNRALNVTVTALEVGTTVALALADQQAVLDKVDAVNKTTSDLISGTASRLKTQGVAIQRQASSAQLSMDSLKSAFNDINAAIQDLSDFRMKALPQMASTVLELDKITGDGEKTIQKMVAKKNSPEKL